MGSHHHRQLAELAINGVLMWLLRHCNKLQALVPFLLSLRVIIGQPAQAGVRQEIQNRLSFMQRAAAAA
jgi:hypothetical protein